MRSRSLKSLPPRLEAGRRRFERWRSQRKARSRIPESLWRTAVELAEEYGVHRTAKELRLNYDALKARVGAGSGNPVLSGESSAKFVELIPGMVPAARKCVVEFADTHGARMSLHLDHADAMVLAALASAFVRGVR